MSLSHLNCEYNGIFGGVKKTVDYLGVVMTYIAGDMVRICRSGLLIQVGLTNAKAHHNAQLFSRLLLCSRVVVVVKSIKTSETP